MGQGPHTAEEQGPARSRVEGGEDGGRGIRAPEGHAGDGDTLALVLAGAGDEAGRPRCPWSPEDMGPGDERIGAGEALGPAVAFTGSRRQSPRVAAPSGARVALACRCAGRSLCSLAMKDLLVGEGKEIKMVFWSLYSSFNGP